jgi:hypothetical protein
MSILTRGQIATIGDILQLRTVFREPTTGEPVDLDFFPQISIQEPSGTVIYPFTSTGVYRVDTGIYGFDYSVGQTPTFGVWVDNWRGESGSNILFNSHNFVIHVTQAPTLNTDGYVALGDEVPFNYSQNAIKNINKIMALVKARLNSSGKAIVKDEYGNQKYEDCDIYTVQQLTTFIIASLSAFNMIPTFTAYTFEDNQFFDIYIEIIVRMAVIYALSSKALIERGREFQITDNGVSFQPPGVSDMLNTQYSSEYQHWESDVKMIKASMRPAPIGLGTLRPLSAAPQFMRLRHLRARRIM